MLDDIIVCPSTYEVCLILLFFFQFEQIGTNEEKFQIICKELKQEKGWTEYSDSPCIASRSKPVSCLGFLFCKSTS